MTVHNHPPYRPVCNERRMPDGSLRGACMETLPTSLRVPLDYEHVGGMNHGRAYIEVPIEYDPTLPERGRREVNAHGSCPIVLREWNEQVLLHELLHVVLGSPNATEADPHGHRTINRIEVALWETGWRMTTPAPRLGGEREGEEGSDG